MKSFTFFNTRTIFSKASSSSTAAAFASAASSSSSSFLLRSLAAGTFVGFSLAAAHSNNSSNNWSLKWRQEDEQRDTSSSSLALCGPTSKAPDTPEYLLPYYLRDTKSRFSHYASIREKGKPRKMSPSDFLAAMLALPDSALEGLDDEKTKIFTNFFKWADADGDGTISYREFAFLANILAYPLRDMKVLFRMFDEQDKGGVTPDEFVKLLISVSDGAMCPKLRSGIVRAMFLPEEFKRLQEGADGPIVRPAKNQGDSSSSSSRSKDDTAASASAEVRMISDKVPPTAVCTFDRFSGVVQRLERMIAEAEFRLADKDGKGHVTKEEFGNMILSSIHGRHLPIFLVENLRRLSKQKGKEAEVQLDTYLLFSEMFRRAEDVASALQLYASAGYAIKADDLKRALDRCVLLSRPINPDEAELAVAMFDANSDGELHIDEFVTMLRAKASYAGVLPRKKEKENLFSRTARCTAEAIAELRRGPDDE